MDYTQFVDYSRVEVRLPFTVEDPDHGSYSDALTFAQETWSSLTTEDIAEAIRTRYENWLQMTSAPQEPPAPDTPPDPQEQAQTLADQLAALAQQAQALANQDPQDPPPPPGE